MLEDLEESRASNDKNKESQQDWADGRLGITLFGPRDAFNLAALVNVGGELLGGALARVGLRRERASTGAGARQDDVYHFGKKRALEGGKNAKRAVGVKKKPTE